MRKKSHLSLAHYLMNSMMKEDILIHKKAFYIGSILPDCVPSFITRRHCIEDTFHLLKDEINKVTYDYDIEKGITGYYCRHLGVITHYIADYFTLPHNSIFTGSLKQHCVYEKELKFALRKYVTSGEAIHVREENRKFRTVDEICEFIKNMHDEYLKVVNAVKVDCMYIVKLCHKVVDAILQIFELSFINKQTAQFEAV